MTIRDVPVAQIKPAAYNPRVPLQRGDPAYERLRRSIDTFGAVEPMVWNERTGNLVGGHVRFSILRERGDAAVTVSVVDLSERDEKVLNLALNRHAGEWDYPALAEMIRDLEANAADLDVAGFTEADLAKLVTWTPADDAAIGADADPGPRKHLRIETVAVTALRPHPRNYLTHPPDQLAHLVASIRQHGYYRNIVIARDGTVLAGHGVLDAVRAMGWETVPVIRLDVAADEPRALKVLTGDNATRHLAEVDDRALSELLREVKDTDLEGLLGTGFDEAMLANLIFVTRPASEIRSHDAAAEWVGLPGYDNPGDAITITLHFRTAEDRAACLELLALDKTVGPRGHSAWWPPKERNDRTSLRFESGAAE